MNQKILFLLVALILLGIGVFGWSLWEGLTRNVASMDIYISLRTTTLQSSHAGNNSINFVMEPNTRGNLTFSVINNGTMPLEGVTFHIDRISSGLTLMTGNRHYSLQRLGSLEVSLRKTRCHGDGELFRPMKTEIIRWPFT